MMAPGRAPVQEDIYADVMTRNEREAARIEEQFHLLTTNIGYIIHPSIAAVLPASPVIADLGTGTGAFVRRLAAQYPQATLHGFDISPALFPHASQLPANVSLSLLDIKEPYPTSMVGVYDLVHVRMVVAAMQAGEWRGVMQNLVRLLKPGGHLQWEECDFASVKHLRGADDVCASPVDAARRLGSLFRTALSDRFAHGWDVLQEHMVTVGLRRGGADVVSSDRVAATRRALTANGMRAILAWARLVKALESEELERLGKQAFEEIEMGCYVRFDIHVAWGQKPSKS